MASLIAMKFKKNFIIAFTPSCTCCSPYQNSGAGAGAGAVMNQALDRGPRQQLSLAWETQKWSFARNSKNDNPKTSSSRSVLMQKVKESIMCWSLLRRTSKLIKKKLHKCKSGANLQIVFRLERSVSRCQFALADSSASVPVSDCEFLCLDRSLPQT